MALLSLGLALLLVFFPWDVLRGPINRYVSQKTGRHFAITRHLQVHWGHPTRVVLDGVEMANPPWARAPFLLQAQRVEFEVLLLPLWSGRLVLPQLSLQHPVLDLERASDGRRTWGLDLQQSGEHEWPTVGSLVVDRGELRYFSPEQRIDVRAELALQPDTAAALPLSFRAQGQWRGQRFQSQGRAGSVLQLSADQASPFPLELSASAGGTRLQARGRVTHLANLDGVALHFELQGKSLSDLDTLLGVNLAESPPYKVQGQLDKRGAVWGLGELQGSIGRSDWQGHLQLDRTQTISTLKGELSLRQLDLRDFGPLLGASSVPGRPSRRGSRPPGKVLPTKNFDFKGLSTLNADVLFNAAHITGVPTWPLESARAQIKLEQGALQLQSLSLGVAGGQMTGQLVLDSRLAPARWQVRLDGRALQLNRLLPAVNNTRSSLGLVSGKIDLTGHGNSTAQVLGSATGDVAFLMGAGRISNILLEFVGLDAGEIIKFLIGGDQIIRLRCAAAAFDVRQGLMSSRVILLDTVDTVVHGAGTVNLANETLDLRLEPEPKDMSILSLRSPLHVGGTFAKPDTGPDKAALAGRAGLALALAAINPLLGLAATVETGPGQDAQCAQTLRRAAAPRTGPSARSPR